MVLSLFLRTTPVLLACAAGSSTTLLLTHTSASAVVPPQDDNPNRPASIWAERLATMVQSNQPHAVTPETVGESERPPAPDLPGLPQAPGARLPDPSDPEYSDSIALNIPRERPMTHREILERMMSGNRKFFENPAMKELRSSLRFRQQPAVAVLTCSDSRVPAEIVFGRSLGELFVIRTAGNVVEDSVLGSIEFAIAVLGCPVLLVLGHTRCGAVSTTINALGAKHALPRQHRRFFNASYADAIVRNIAPAIYDVSYETRSWDKNWPNPSVEFVNLCVESNVRHQVDMIVQKSAVVRRGLRNGTLQVWMMVYDIDVGLVKMLDEPLDALE